MQQQSTILPLTTFTTRNLSNLTPGMHQPTWPATAIKVHAPSFHDHVGSASVMVFWAPIDQPLPPLCNFTIYVTSPDITSPEFFGAVDLKFEGLWVSQGHFTVS